MKTSSVAIVMRLNLEIAFAMRSCKYGNSSCHVFFHLTRFISITEPISTAFFCDFISSSPGSSVSRQDLTFSGKQLNHNQNALQSGKSYLTTDQNILLNDLNNANFTNIGVNHRGMPIIKFNNNIGNVINIQGVNLGQTPYGVIHINGTGQIHIVPWLPNK